MGTIRDLNELTTLAATDYLLVADTSDLVDKDKKMLVNKLVMKNGTPVTNNVASWNDANSVEDGGFAVSAIARKTGTPVAGHMATWLDANTVQDGGVVAVDEYLESDVMLVDPAFTTNSAAHRFATISLALAQCTGGETIYIAPGIYTETVAAGIAGVKLIGSGAPRFDTASGRLVGGTIIRGAITMSNANGVQYHHLGVDLVGINGTDCIGGGVTTTIVGRRFSNLTLLGNGAGALAHGLYLIGNENLVDNVRVYNCYHGIAVHGSYTNINNVYIYSCYGTSLIIKAKGGIHCIHNNVSNVVIQGDPASLTLRAGPFMLQSSASVDVRYCNISNVSAKYCVNGVVQLERLDNTGVISECSFTNIVSDSNLDSATIGDYSLKSGNNIILNNCRSTNRVGGYGFRVNPIDNVADVYLYAGYSDATGSGTNTGIFKLSQMNGASNILKTNVVSTIIAGGAITATSSWLFIDTEGAAATDDLDTINGGSIGMVVFLETQNAARDVTIKNGTGNIDCKTDLVLDGNRDICMLIYSPANRWERVAFADNI